MGLLDRIAARRGSDAVRADAVTLEEFGYLLGQSRGGASKTKAGVTMSARRALAVPAWYSGVRYISETIASLPVFQYRDAPTGRTRRAPAPWMAKPDVELPWFGLVEHWMMSLLHRGNAYAWKVRNDQQQVVGLRPLHPDRVRVGQTDTGVKVFKIDNIDYGWTCRDVLHIPGLSYDGVVGLDPISLHAESLGTMAAADEFAGRFFGQGTMERQYLSVPQTIDPPEANRLAAQWNDAHSGLVNAHRVAVLGGGAEYKTIGLDPQQTQLLETRKYSATDISRMLRLPPHKIYDLEHATFSNIEHQSIETVIDGIRPWCERLEAWVNFDPDLSPPSNFTEFEIEGLLRGDLKARYEAYQVGISGGFLMPSEPRHKENLPHIEGSNYLLRPLAMAQLGPDAQVTGEDAAMTVAEMTLALQKIYLAVGSVITADEARQILNKAGAGLTGPAPSGGTQ